MKFNSKTLIEYCDNNHINLLNDYSKIKINRESYIEGNCIYDNCFNSFNKNFRQLLKTGAYCSFCMAQISNNKIRNSKVKYDINILNKFCYDNNILLSDDYSNKYINRDTIIKGFCKNSDCKIIFSKPLRQLLKINGYCENCSKENGKIKIIETNIKQFGVDNVMKCENLKNKQKQTMFKKYGVEHNSQLESIKQQKQNKSIEKYGTEYVLQSNEVKEKGKQTNLQKYGVENPQQNKEIREKTIETTLNRYGVEYFCKTKEFKEKVIKTNMEKYGVPHHSQNSEIAENMLKSSYNKKQYTLPSGKIITYQGYENFALDELLFVEKINEDDIITERNNVPEIWYNDENNKRHRHYVDIYIKSQNRCIEVKSTWTNQKKNNVLEKKNAAESLGYKYDLWIYDKKGNKIEL
jgi:hypothetical protein